jgi:IclR family transcriptional regulator, KDG regulon repressor
VSDEPNSSLRRALDLLEALATDEALSEGGWGVKRLADHLRRDPSQVSRTLRTLADASYVDRDRESLRYRIGWQIFALASRSADRRLVTAARPIISRLAERDLGERIHLTVRMGTEALTILTEGPPHTIQSVAWAGRPVPAWNTASGRALLIDVERAELAQLFRDVPFVGGGPNAPRDVDELFSRILRARRQGHATVEEEFEAGLVAVSAPIRDFRGDVIAALNVSGPAFRLGGRLSEAGEIVRSASEELSLDLGWTGGHGTHSRPPAADSQALSDPARRDVAAGRVARPPAIVR